MNAIKSKIFTQQIYRTRINKSIALVTSLTTLTPAYKITFCEGDNENNDIFSKIKDAVSRNVEFDAVGQNIGDRINQVIATGVPTEVSYGFVCGFSSGLALKKVGKVASIVFGLGFATLQALSYAGYIEVDHTQLQKDVEKAMDLNKDGKVDAKDGEQAMEKIMQVLQFGMPGGAGFAAGFVGGFRSG